MVEASFEAKHALLSRFSMWSATDAHFEEPERARQRTDLVESAFDVALTQSTGELSTATKMEVGEGWGENARRKFDPAAF
jgi:hypothetical protein